jgi:hypothetical protein
LYSVRATFFVGMFSLGRRVLLPPLSPPSLGSLHSWLGCGFATCLVVAALLVVLFEGPVFGQ